MKLFLYQDTNSQQINPLTVENVLSVLQFLEEIFSTCSPDYSDSEKRRTSPIIPTILQTIPRIFKKDVDGYLRPTVKFLKVIYPGNPFIKL